MGCQRFTSPLPGNLFLAIQETEIMPKKRASIGIDWSVADVPLFQCFKSVMAWPIRSTVSAIALLGQIVSFLGDLEILGILRADHDTLGMNAKRVHQWSKKLESFDDASTHCRTDGMNKPYTFEAVGQVGQFTE